MSVRTIFQEGMKERKRRKSLGKVSHEFKEKEQTLSAQLAALGQKAWDAKADISAFADVQAALADLQKALDDLNSQGERLRKEKQESEEARNRENERLGAAIREADEKKRKTDGRLNEQKGALQNALKETQKASGRLAAIVNERIQLQNKGADPATTEAEKSEIARGLERLAAEEAELKAANAAREAAEKPVAAQVAALQEDAAQMQKQLDGLRGEQKRMLAETDKKISGLKGELSKNSDKTKEAEGRQKGEFRRLGEKLAAAPSMDPALAREMAAVQGAKAEMNGVQALIGGLERQKDEGQVSAYKKMMAILVGGVVLLLVVAAALFILLGPKKKASPFGGLAEGGEAAAQTMQEVAQRLQKGFGGVKSESEKIQAGKIEIAPESALKSSLPAVGGWQLQNPHYTQGSYDALEIASLQADFSGAGDDSVRYQVTDAGTASALLAPLKMVISMGIRVDDADVMQQMSTVNGLPVVERIDKRDGEATLGIIHRDRYLIELKTKSARGLELLREFAGKIDLSRLPQ